MTVDELINMLSQEDKHKPVKFLVTCEYWGDEEVDIHEVADDGTSVVIGDDLPAERYQKDYKYER